MKIEQVKRIFEFLEEKEKHKAPFIWKLENDIPLREEDLNIEGNLYLRDSEITSLPKGLKVGGWLDLSRSKIKSLPEGLKVGGDLNLTYTEITSLPEGLEVGGTLYLYKSALVEYTDEELREMVKLGFIQGKIYR
jgi:hypothetical protein